MKRHAGQFQPGGSGRPKGAENKMTRAVKDALNAAYADLGGDARLVEWAQENLTEFYRIWSRLLPKQIEGADGGLTAFNVVIRPHGVDHSEDQLVGRSAGVASAATSTTCRCATWRLRGCRGSVAMPLAPSQLPASPRAWATAR
jgi:hypothetical protein